MSISNNITTPTAKIDCISNATITEGQKAVFDVQLANVNNVASFIKLNLSDISATLGQDYGGIEVSFDGSTWEKLYGDTVHIAGGADKFHVRVSTTDDSAVEQLEQFKLTASTNGTSGSGTGTINDNDKLTSTLSIASITNATVTEGQAAVFDINLANVNNNGIVKLNLTDLTAQLDADYCGVEVSFDGQNWTKLQGDSVNVSRGTNKFQVRVSTIDDNIVEGVEQFRLTASTDASSATAIGTINDNDKPNATATIGSISNATVTEGQKAVFDVNLANVNSAASFVKLNLSDISATLGGDYGGLEVSFNNGQNWETLIGDTVHIAGGANNFKVRVNTTDDSTVESVEQFRLTATTNGSTGSGTGTINDNDKLPKASLGNFVWEDKNFNGVQDTGESGIAGVKVNLLDAGNKTLGTTTTDANGQYLFDQLEAGDYKVQVVAPSGYFVTKQDQGGNDETDSDLDRATGMSAVTNLTPGENDRSLDAGLYRKATVGDQVWQDYDHDDLMKFDYEAQGFAGVKVNLLSNDRQVVQSTVTGKDGYYKFQDVDPGLYSVQFDASGTLSKGNWSGNIDPSWQFKVNSAAADPNSVGKSVVLRDLNYTTSTGVFQLESGQVELTKDAYLTPLAIDLNGDGVQTVSVDQGVTFDILNIGQRTATGWVSGQDGLLAIDNNGNGSIDNRDELFGGVNVGDGFAKLSSFDSNQDGVVDAQDKDWQKLNIWQDKNVNGITDAGELNSLASHGISSLNTNYTNDFTKDTQGNILGERSSAIGVNGQSMDMVDVYFKLG
jgi:SdrD B-like domain/Calx-beta domain